jgi:uncharacterized protein YcnI
MRHRLVLAAATAATALLLLAAPAQAHVTVNPNEAPKGGFTKLSFRVPNEKEVATVKVEVAFPADAPVAEVSTRPIPGWTAAVEKTGEAVTRVTWSGGTIAPGEFQEFDVSLGPLPDKLDRMVFKALQTYADGEVVRWIDEPPAAGAAEPDHPAPVLTLTAATADHHATSAASTTSDGTDGLAIAALVVGALGLLTAIAAMARGRAR